MKFTVEISAPSAPKGAGAREQNSVKVRMAHMLKELGDSFSSAFRAQGSFERGDIRVDYKLED